MKLKLISLIAASLLILSACGIFGNGNKNTGNTFPNSNSNSNSNASTGTETENGSNSDSNSNSGANSNSSANSSSNANADNSANTDSGTNANGSTNPETGSNTGTIPSGLDTTEKSWYYIPKTNGEPSGEPQDVINLVNAYDAYYLGDTSRKIIYLTFDEGYENGYTSKILDVLAANNVKAAFFVTKPYITSNKELVQRMAREGHLVCNHSSTHVSMASLALKSRDTFNKEFYDTEEAYTEATGKTMDKFFRPPMGNYSELSLYYTKALGYKTIFWSFAYRDWETDNQPDESEALSLIRERTHNGGIFLLHAVSKTNADILDSLIKGWKSEGYEFCSLYDLPQK